MTDDTQAYVIPLGRDGHGQPILAIFTERERAQAYLADRNDKGGELTLDDETEEHTGQYTLSIMDRPGSSDRVADAEPIAAYPLNPAIPEEQGNRLYKVALTWSSPRPRVLSSDPEFISWQRIDPEFKHYYEKGDLSLRVNRAMDYYDRFGETFDTFSMYVEASNSAEAVDLAKAKAIELKKTGQWVRLLNPDSQSTSFVVSLHTDYDYDESIDEDYPEYRGEFRSYIPPAKVLAVFNDRDDAQAYVADLEDRESTPENSWYSIKEHPLNVVQPENREGDQLYHIEINWLEGENDNKSAQRVRWERLDQGNPLRATAGDSSISIYRMRDQDGVHEIFSINCPAKDAAHATQFALDKFTQLRNSGHLGSAPIDETTDVPF